MKFRGHIKVFRKPFWRDLLTISFFRSYDVWISALVSFPCKNRVKVQSAFMEVNILEKMRIKISGGSWAWNFSQSNNPSFCIFSSVSWFSCVFFLVFFSGGKVRWSRRPAKVRVEGRALILVISRCQAWIIHPPNLPFRVKNFNWIINSRYAALRIDYRHRNQLARLFRFRYFSKWLDFFVRA